MSVQALGGPVRAQRSKLRLEHFVMGGAVLCLIVLVVLPLFSLLLGSVKGEAGLSLEHFQEVMTGRLYLTALKNSLILGAWTGLFSLLIGVSLAWAVSRTNVPAKPLIQITASLSYLSPPFLTAIAYVYLYSPNAGLLNVLLRDVLGVPWLTFNVFSMTGLVLVTVLHTFPFVYLLASSALQSVDASYEEAAQILGAGKFRTAFSVTAPLVAPAILSGTLLSFVNAIALFGSQAIIGLPGRIFTLPTRIYALFDYPPEYGLASAMSLLFIVITVIALYLQRAFLARRSFVTLGGKGARPQLMDLGPARWLVFGFVVVLVCCHIGLTTRGGPREIGAAVTRAGQSVRSVAQGSEQRAIDYRYDHILPVADDKIVVWVRGAWDVTTGDFEASARAASYQRLPSRKRAEPKNTTVSWTFCSRNRRSGSRYSSSSLLGVPFASKSELVKKLRARLYWS